MKEKGFTLVELLAIIIILGALLTIAVMSYSKLISKSKVSVYKDEEISLKGAAESMLTYCETAEEKPAFCDDTVKIPSYNETIRIELDKLVSAKFMNKIVDSQSNGESCIGYVEITNVGEVITNLKYKVCLKCSGYESSDCD